MWSMLATPKAIQNRMVIRRRCTQDDRSRCWRSSQEPTRKTKRARCLRQVDSGTELTWNEPTFQFTQPSIGTMIVGTIIGTGVICLFALVSGLAFGGVRLVVKRALPDKVFDRSDQLQILQLGLSSKPINAEDFYGIGATDKN